MLRSWRGGSASGRMKGPTCIGTITLGGAVEWAQPGSAGFEDIEFEGAAAAHAASVPVTLFFTVANTPLS